MSDTKLDPRSLTAEEIHAATTRILADPLLHRFYNWSIDGCRALFAPAASETASAPMSPETERVMLARQLLKSPESEQSATPKVKCRNCEQEIPEPYAHWELDQPLGGPPLYTCQRRQPAPPEPAAQDSKNRGLYNKFIVNRADGKSEPGEKHDGCEYFVLDLTHDKFAPSALRAYASACAGEYPALSADLRGKFPEPAAQGEMPEAVRNALLLMRDIASDFDDGGKYKFSASLLRDVSRKLESWWRTHSQPVAVGMSSALERVLDCAEMDANRDRMGGHETTADRTMSAIREVRQQAAQGKPKVELGKVREGIEKLAKASRNSHWLDLCKSILAEIDAAEGRK